MTHRDDDEPKRTVPVDCQKLASVLGDYVDGQLAPETHTAVDAHISQCAPCMAFLKQYRFAPEAVRKLLLKAVPAELEDRVLSFLRSRCKKD